MSEGGVNPYEAPSGDAVPLVADELETATGSRWRWRKLLLQSIIYLRAFAVFNAILVGRESAVWIFGVWESLWTEGLEPWRVPPLSLALWGSMSLLYLASSAMFLYSCIVLWYYARELRRVAPDTDPDPTRLADLHLRFWKASLLSTLLNLGSNVVGYFSDRYYASMAWPID
ncbi:MAG TPA: hypothetical protein VMP01_13820 [Pirellulaceae bacterium]|nr:hypothetical protein [Pirellulaceae bacterium]